MFSVKAKVVTFIFKYTHYVGTKIPDTLKKDPLKQIFNDMYNMSDARV